MSGLVKSPLQATVVEGIYNDVLTGNSRYYYFLGKTDRWSVAEGATPGIDGVAIANGLVAPTPLDTFKYEIGVRNNAITYKLVKSSDVAFVIRRTDWKINTVYDMYDDSLSFEEPAYSGAISLETATFFVMNSLNNVYKCISNNYDAHSTVEPSGTSPDEFVTADGYIWKFMYYIPVALQHKFLTADHMPVMTELRRRFYENGAIGNVAVQDPGSGYTNNVVLSVSGDGFLENNPYSVDHVCVMTNNGKGYKQTFTISTAVYSVDHILYTATGHTFVNGDVVSIRGMSPSGYNGDYTIGGCVSNQFTVTKSNPGAFVSGGTVVKSVLTYSAPLWGNSKIQITGYPTIDYLGSITAITNDVKVGPIADPVVYGYGYDNTATVTIAPPFVKNFDWIANTTYTTSNIIQANNNFYLVSNGGTTSSTLPTDTSGSPITYGTCELTYIGTQATAVLILAKTEARMLPQLQGGQISGVEIVDGGVGYTYCNIIAQDSPINETAILIPDITIGNIDTIQADVELAALARIGAISYIKMVWDPIAGQHLTGSGYGVDTTVTITGDGQGATAKPIIQNGSIIGIELTNGGTGYKREATVTINPQHFDQYNNYIGAQARAIFSPSGGHGSNAIREFYSNSIMFYSVLSDERIHGLQNLNDYRQFGIIKNPKRHASTSRVSILTATSCWMITTSTTINTSNFVKDDVLNQGGNEIYRIIEIKGSKMVIQAYSDTAPSNSNFINQTAPRIGELLSVSTITAPQVDKFSGDILFFDNKLPFVVTQDQMIMFRTLISF